MISHLIFAGKSIQRKGQRIPLQVLFLAKSLSSQVSESESKSILLSSSQVHTTHLTIGIRQKVLENRKSNGGHVGRNSIRRIQEEARNLWQLFSQFCPNTRFCRDRGEDKTQLDEADKKTIEKEEEGDKSKSEYKHKNRPGNDKKRI